MSRTRDPFETLEYGSAPEDPGPALTWLEGHGRVFGHFIDGRFTDPSRGDTLEAFNPATERPLAQVLEGTVDDVGHAVAAARSAQPGWWALGPHGRARHLGDLAHRIRKRAEVLAILESLDTGMTLRETRGVDLPLVARHLHHHAGWARLMGDELQGHGPIGVVGQITPCTSPLLMLAWKVAPALATGNTVVLKPSEHAPLGALRFAELCLEVGLPAGVVNVVTGGSDTGAALVAHPDVDMISFTGSTGVGRAIREATAGSGKRLTLELGGPSPFLVFEDADLDSAVEGVADAVWHNQGRVAAAGVRILVQEGVAATLEDKLRARLEMVRVGDPLESAVDMGAVVSPARLERFRALVAEGRAGGADIWQASGDLPAEGWFHPPTLWTGVSAADPVVRSELLGPVAVLMTFRTPEEGVSLANDTRYGLAASVWSESIGLALDVAAAVKAGTVWVNGTHLFDAASGFGGYRESGFGREGGKEGLWDYVQPVAAVPGVGEVPLGDASAPPDVGLRRASEDGAASLPVFAREGRPAGEVAFGTPRDVAGAVEAARRAQTTWAARTAYDRSRVLWDLAEMLKSRADEMVHGLARFSGDEDDAAREVEASVSRLFAYSAWTDRWAGRTHPTPRCVTLAVHEPLGVIGAVCPDVRPLLAFVSCVAPLAGLGNACVVIPSESAPLPAADFIRVMEASHMPPGVVNLVTGPRDELVPTLAAHDDVDGVWCFAPGATGAEVERGSIGNLKQTWVKYSVSEGWISSPQGEGEEFLRHSSQVKSVWIPYGV